jgi:protein-disulfide isomerase
MKQRFDFVIFLSGLVAGVALGATLSHFNLIPSLRSAPAEPVRSLASASPGAQPAHVRGNPSAPAVLEEFGDFQCPPCGALYPELKKIEADYGERLAVIFRNFPLDIHKHAWEASRAAEAAAAQGRFWEMHDRLYERQEEWGESCDVRQQFTAYARDLGLDAKRFESDMAAQEIEQRIRLDQQRGESAQIDGTPAVFLNGREIPPSSRTPEGMRALIDAALKGK